MNVQERRYDVSSINPKGNPENKNNCIKEVWPNSSAMWHSYQCQRKRGYGKDGLYCKQHAKKEEANQK